MVHHQRANERVVDVGNEVYLNLGALRRHLHRHLVPIRRRRRDRVHYACSVGHRRVRAERVEVEVAEEGHALHADVEDAQAGVVEVDLGEVHAHEVLALAGHGDPVREAAVAVGVEQARLDVCGGEVEAERRGRDGWVGQQRAGESGAAVYVRRVVLIAQRELARRQRVLLGNSGAQAEGPAVIAAVRRGGRRSGGGVLAMYAVR